MARSRRRKNDPLELIAPIAGLVMLVGMVSPKAREAIFAISIAAFWLMGIFLVGLICFGIYRWTTRALRSTSSRSLPESSSDETSSLSVIVPEMEAPNQTQNTRQTSIAELLEQLHSIDWFQFEKLVALTYRKLGYMVTRRGGANPDGGIDLLIEKEGQRTAVQCKHWKAWKVGVKAVREFLGALTDAGIQKGIFITLRGYSSEARQLAEKHGIEIVDELGLTKLLEATDANYDPETLAILRDTRNYCPKCEREMVLRTAAKGTGAGKKFWGCSGYPRCRYTMPAENVCA